METSSAHVCAFGRSKHEPTAASKNTGTRCDVLSSFLRPLLSLLLCAGPEFGLKYAVNTPSLLGCSGAVAAITAYKAALQPMGLPGVILPLPLPIAVLGFVYCCLYIREKVRGLHSRRVPSHSWGLVG